MKFPFLSAVIVTLCTVLPDAFAQVVISEVHYHPIEEGLFNPDGSPVLDLTDDVHEFVELQNTGVSSANISGWTLVNGIDFTFPANTSIPAGGFLVIAKNPSRLATVYGLNVASILGPFTGTLSNDADTIQLKKADGSTADAIDYSSTFPWAISADALGASDNFTGINPLTYNYKGRSLQRVSASWSGNDPANWLASPLVPGPTPGAAQAVTRSIPKPIVVSVSAEQLSDEAKLIRNNQAVKISCQFSNSYQQVPLTGVSVEYFNEDVNLNTETRNSVAMTSIGNGEYTATLPGRPDRTVVRYRIRANRGDGDESISPRADDPQMVINSSGVREGWHAYFVMPVRALTINPAPSVTSYDVFVATADIGTPGVRDDTKTLSKNINQTPRRVMPDANGGYPRTETYDSFLTPIGVWWNGHVPAVFVSGDGVVRDARIRYHGSRYRRSEGRQSYKIFFPRCNPLNGQTAVFETDKGAPANQSSATLPDYRYEALGEIYRAAGIPCSFTPRVDMYINGNVLLQRMEQSVVDGHFLDNYYAQQAALIPGSKPLKYGEPFKSEGTDEGPYGTGNGAPLAQKTIGTPTVVWTPLQRYQTTYPMDGNEWKGHKDFKTMIDAVAAAKTAGTASLRAYLSANWDVDRTLTYIAIKNWSCPWDDSIHNYYIYRQSDGKWTLLPWDVDFELTTRDPNDITTFSIFKNNNQFKDVFISAFNAEFRQKAFVMNNTLLHPDNLAAMKYAGQSLNSLWGNNWASWIQSRNTAVNNQLALGVFDRPNKPTHTGPANGTTALPPSFLTTSAYTHTSNSIVGSNAHTKTKWEIRAADGSWAAPLYVNTSTTNLTSLPIPYEELTWGRTYFWRATYLDAVDHPSSISDETSFTFGPVPVAETLIPLDAVTQWKYNNVDQFTNQSWTQSGYDDSAWSSGAGVFGHSNNPLALGNLAPPQVLRTDIPLTQPPDNAVGRTAFYFRKKFNFPGSVIGATLKAKIIVDDGVVIHLNGHEIYRLGVNPTAAITYSSTATRAVGAYVYEGPIDLPVTYLLPGENQLAVEVHQQSAGSNDFLMGLQLDTTYLTQGSQIALNEICADNRSLLTNGGKNPDYIELFNNTGAAFSLDGWGLTDDVLVPNKYLFPIGTTIPAQGFLVVWADNDVAAPGLHTGFGLDNGGQTVILTQGSDIRDNVTFGPQAADFPIGRTSSGSGVWALVTATPNAPNVTKSLGSAATLKINEWMAEPVSGSDWFEIYNPDVNPVALSGLWLSDTPGTPNITQIPALSFIAPGGFTRFDADGTTRGYNSAKFKLSLAGDSLVLTTAGGSTIDSLTFGLQQSAVAEGRLPDGGATIVSFIKTASPSERNWLPLNNVVINEVLSSSSPPAVDTIELLNASGTAVDISGWWLSDSVANPMKYQLPVAPPMAASSFQVFDEHQFNTGAPGSFAIDAVSGETIVLSQVDGSGNLTGYRSQVKIGGAEPGVSFGRIVTAAGESFPPMSALTFGAANASPKIGSVIINEIMYHPVDDPPGTDNTLDEFIELQNITGTTVKLYDPANPSNAWKLKDAVDFVFPPNASIPPAGYALVVSFDPVATPAQLTAFRNKYAVPNAIPIFGPWSGKLANDTDSVELDRPLAPVLGSVPYVQVDHVNYTDLAPWPPSTISTGPDGFGESIQRKSRTAYGNDPANWEAGSPRAGIDNLSQSILNVTLETDGDGIPDDWEIANGLNPNDPNDATSDLDGDGANNLSEYIAGTAANNSSSVFAAAATSVVNGVQISFTAMPNKSYSIFYSDQLGAGSWTKLTDVPAQATEHPVQMIDAISTSRRFYKVVTPQQP